MTRPAARLTRKPTRQPTHSPLQRTRSAMQSHPGGPRENRPQHDSISEGDEPSPYTPSFCFRLERGKAPLPFAQFHTKSRERHCPVSVATLSGSPSTTGCVERVMAPTTARSSARRPNTERTAKRTGRKRGRQMPSTRIGGARRHHVCRSGLTRAETAITDLVGLPWTTAKSGPAHDARRPSGRPCANSVANVLTDGSAI